MKVELGITSFADNNDIITEEGRQPALSAAQRIRNIIEEIGICSAFHYPYKIIKCSEGIIFR